MILLILSLVASPVCVTRVHDGDTIRLYSGERVRIENIDAPELFGSARCSTAAARRLAGSRNPPGCDYGMALCSRDALTQFLATGTVRIKRTAIDRYGRTLPRLTVNGIDAGRYLIGLGLARRWR